MGLVDARRVTMETTQQYKDKMVSPFTRFLKGGPTWVTYYSVSNDESTVSMGTQQIRAIIGEDCPILRNKINNFVIYGFKQLNPSLDYGEYGYTTDITSECTVLPETIVPKVNDLFTVDILGTVYLFKVNKTNMNIIESNTYYNIEYELYKTEWNESDIKISEEYRFIYDNIGTESKTIILSESHDKIERINKLIVNISKYYIESFYKPRINSFVYDSDKNISLYNKYLNHFIIKYQLFSTYDYPISIVQEVDMERRFNYNYDHSIYGVIESRNVSNLKVNKTITMPIYRRHSILNAYKTRFMHLEISDLQADEFYNLVRGELYDRLTGKENAGSMDKLEEIIFNYLTNANESIIPEVFMQFLEGYTIYDVSFTDYIYIPLIIVILRNTIEYYTKYKGDTKSQLSKAGMSSI